MVCVDLGKLEGGDDAVAWRCVVMVSVCISYVCDVYGRVRLDEVAFWLLEIPRGAADLRLTTAKPDQVSALTARSPRFIPRDHGLKTYLLKKLQTCKYLTISLIQLEEYTLLDLGDFSNANVSLF